MLILTLRTESPNAKLSLFEDTLLLGREDWLADRTLADTIHLKIKSLLEAHQKEWQNIQGLVCFKGPGSFTGLRIGISVANAIAYGLSIPIVGCQEDNWDVEGIKKLLSGENDKIVIPFYGSEPHITPPKK